MKRSLIIVIHLFLMNTIYSQQISPIIISTSGNSYSNSAVKMDYSVGELAIETKSNSSEILTQGFHQPNYIITSADEIPIEYGDINVYPNPTTDVLNIDLKFHRIENIIITLYDFNGNIIWQTNSTGDIHVVTKDITSFPSGNFVLHIEDSKKHFTKSFKIQKIN